jgi:prepilin-type N-terminal cleavage/methylation domain-containing protein
MTLLARIGARLRDERGFSLPELLVATMVGVIVLLGALTILETSQRAQARVSDRSESIARGRTAMEQIVQRLRSQVCIGSGSPAIIYGDDSHVTFYADLRDGYTDSSRDWGTNVFVPSKMDLAYARGALTETVYTGTADTSRNATFPYVFSSTPALRRVIVDKLSLQSGMPFFTYFSFSASDPIEPTNQLTTPLAASDRDNVVQITVSFQALPSRLNSAYAGEPFRADAFVRTADPTDPEHSPLCF